MSNPNEKILREIEAYIADIALPAKPERLYAPIKYTLEEGGKRLRPMLLMLAYELYGKLNDGDHAGRDEALAAAAAVEVFHNFTLLHDDIMDNAATRRGKDSVHVKWSENVAILSGDVMLILAYQMLAKVQGCNLAKVLEIFNTMAAEVCEGQQYDMDFEEQESVAVAHYLEMIKLKTAVLLGGATLIGAILGGAPEGDHTTLQNFATELGLAFQLQDDLLDTYGDERLGKAIGGDILEGKQTFLKITALERASREEHEALLTTHRDPHLSDSEKILIIKEIYDKLEVAAATETEIKQRFESALALLAKIEGSAALAEYAKSLMNREK
ncbi:MAG: polyprenyl synthetase family protein [Rikenellaceae bacterium]